MLSISRDPLDIFIQVTSEIGDTSDNVVEWQFAPVVQNRCSFLNNKSQNTRDNKKQFLRQVIVANSGFWDQGCHALLPANCFATIGWGTCFLRRVTVANSGFWDQSCHALLPANCFATISWGTCFCDESPLQLVDSEWKLCGPKVTASTHSPEHLVLVCKTCSASKSF